ncbi:MAG TPA: 2-oxoacid:acceptor oxidoreductase family protein, partial [Anaerolineaceae bacterium]|nr:2-oxoacid:acceptor oxidoreductase family protein [Anaerolineaceae bacterium]
MILDTTQKSPHGSERIVNEVCMTICTINGSGSATANNILYRALFRMGIMTSGKNVFPSNIKGLPTWFVIRASARGYTGRIAHDDVVIAMNQVTIQKDIDYLKDGGVLFYADHLELPQIEKDIIVYPMPIKALMKTVDAPRNMTNYLENMLYVGIVGQVMGIPENVLKATIDHQFSGKPAIAESNFNIVNLGYQYALKNIEKKDRFYLEQLPELSDYILTDGNNAGALGALYGGLQFCAWYPITPATSLVESAIGQVGKLRKDPKTGKNTCVILQVEDELAAAGATLGAGWAGLRAMTSTS